MILFFLPNQIASHFPRSEECEKMKITVLARSASCFCHNYSSTRGSHDLHFISSCWFLLYSCPQHLQILLWWLCNFFTNSLRVSGLKKDAPPITPTSSICTTEMFFDRQKAGSGLRLPRLKILFLSGCVILFNVLHLCFTPLTINCNNHAYLIGCGNNWIM